MERAKRYPTIRTTLNLSFVFVLGLLFPAKLVVSSQFGATFRNNRPTRTPQLATQRETGTISVGQVNSTKHTLIL